MLSTLLTLLIVALILSSITIIFSIIDEWLEAAFISLIIFMVSLTGLGFLSKHYKETVSVIRKDMKTYKQRIVNIDGWTEPPTVSFTERECKIGKNLDGKWRIISGSCRVIKRQQFEEPDTQ
jgi:hypothetical protein